MAPLLWTDSHCHLQEPLQAEVELAAMLAGAAEAGVGRMICVGTGLDTSRAAVALAARAAAGIPAVWATVGLHPHDATDGLEPVAALLRSLAGTPTPAVSPPEPSPPEPRPPGSVVAVGECGLDYHYEHSPRATQREVFAAQVALADEHGLALVVHTREAWDDTLAILVEVGPPDSTIIHCFTGGPDEARRCLELGAYLSFSGIVTFKNAGEIREAAMLCPDDKLLVETDSPFLAPVPYRGRPNEPAFVAVVGEAVAALREVPAGTLAQLTTANTVRAFRLAEPVAPAEPAPAPPGG